MDWDLGTCSLLPGELGQWAVQGQGLGSQPYLLNCAAVMSLEGTTFPVQRRLLVALGFVIPFTFKPSNDKKHWKPVSTSKYFKRVVFLKNPGY